MYWLGPVVAALVLAGIAGWVLWFFGLMFVYVPVKALRISHWLKQERCPQCHEPFVKHWANPVDQLYASTAVSSQCPNGHVYTSGNRRAADWAGF
jgi:hypothetical protein